MKLIAVLSVAGALAVMPAAASAATITLSSTITVLGTNVFSGPTFTLVDAVSGTDSLALTADGEVGLANGLFFSNAAGVITRPATTNTGHHPGETAPSLGNGLPYGALMVGNTTLGFVPFFSANAANGLGDSTPPMLLTETRTFADLFGPGFAGLAAGSLLEFQVNDINDGDNNGAFRLTPVPEPASLLLLGTGLGLAAARRRARLK